MKTLLFIGAHPDDETLCTGLFLKAKQKGFNTNIFICTPGKNGKPNHVEELQDTYQILENRNKELELYAKNIQADSCCVIQNSEEVFKSKKTLYSNS